MVAYGKGKSCDSRMHRDLPLTTAVLTNKIEDQEIDFFSNGFFVQV